MNKNVTSSVSNDSKSNTNDKIDAGFVNFSKGIESKGGISGGTAT